MTSMKNTPAYRVESLMKSLGLLDGFTIEETGRKFGKPVFQNGYPDETSSGVSGTDSILSLAQLGGNGNTLYNQDINMRVHFLTPINGNQVAPFYRARMHEIITELKEKGYNGEIQVTNSSFLDDGFLQSGRYLMSAQIRVLIGDLR